MAVVSSELSLKSSASSQIADLITGFMGEDEPQPIGKETLGTFFSAVEIASNSSPYQTFFGLGIDWWQQLVEEPFHEYDFLVFDEGLHGGPAEPGFYEHALNASKFARDYFLKEKHSLSIPSYQEVNKLSCAHFTKSRKKEMLMNAKDAGKFNPRIHNHNCSADISEFYADCDLNVVICEKENITFRDWLSTGIGGQLDLVRKNGMEWWKEVDQRIQQIRFNCCERTAKKMAELNDYIAARSKALGLSRPVAVIKVFPHETHRWKAGSIVVLYQTTPEESAILVKNLFAEFEKNIVKAKTEDEIIRCIADLYQMLEWTHPFADGQGRTDLTLLSALLCKYGLNPAILEEPYFSTLGTLDAWAAKLKIGVQKWKERRLEHILKDKGTPVEEMQKMEILL